MPVFKLSTNLPKDKISDSFLKETSSLVADLLGKPESYVCVMVSADNAMCFAGDASGPCAVGHLSSLGSIGGGKNKQIAQGLFKHITAKLGIPGNRMYISFENLSGADIALNGSTFG